MKRKKSPSTVQSKKNAQASIVLANGVEIELDARTHRHIVEAAQRYYMPMCEVLKRALESAFPLRDDERSMFVKMTASQAAALEDWAKHCRSNPSDMMLALTMDALRMQKEGTSSMEDDIATTIYALDTYVDKRRSPSDPDADDAIADNELKRSARCRVTRSQRKFLNGVNGLELELVGDHNGTVFVLDTALADLITMIAAHEAEIVFDIRGKQLTSGKVVAVAESARLSRSRAA